MTVAKKKGRPKGTNTKKNDTRLRMTDEEVAKLNYCVEKTGKTKTAILMLGLEKVYKDLTE